MDELKGMLIKLLLDYYEHGKNLDTIAIDDDIKPILGYRDIIVSRVESPVILGLRHKLTAKQFFIEQYQEGKCEDITTNPYPEFNNAFFQNIYKLMEDYSKSV